MIKAGGMGLLGLTMPRLLQAAEKQEKGGGIPVAPRARQVIFLFQWGGPSQIDILDMTRLKAIIGE